MEYRRIFYLLVASILVSGVFANSILAESCFCGQACMHGLQPKAKAFYRLHMLCWGNSCKSCNLEKGRTVRAVNAEAQPLNVKTHDTPLRSPTLLDYPPDDYRLNGFESFHACATVPSSPIYLQKLSLLC